MKVRLTISVLLSIVLLGTGLLVPAGRASFSKSPQLKTSSEFVCKAIVHEEEFAWKKSGLAFIPNFLTVTWAKIFSSKIVSKPVPYFAYSSVKYYLLFKVLRN